MAEVSQSSDSGFSQASGCQIAKSEAKDLLRKSGGPLEKFGFRKIFCDLRIVYRPSVRLCVDLLLPFRRVVARLNRPAAAANIKALPAQELIQRSFPVKPARVSIG